MPSYRQKPFSGLSLLAKRIGLAILVPVELLDLTLPTPAENLALDEALLDAETEVLRFWESPTYFVVVGYANRLNTEVKDGIPVPVLRRCSGGGTVVQGPGCLSYSLILRIPADGPLSHVTGTNQFIMRRHAEALAGCSGASVKRRDPPPTAGGSQSRRYNDVHCCGMTDLAIGDRKFSGNAQRRRRHWLLFHGTILYRFDLALVERLLPMPSRQPDYRHDRQHTEFLTNLPLSAEAIRQTLCQAWNVATPCPSWPRERVAALVAERYGREEWHRKFV